MRSLKNKPQVIAPTSTYPHGRIQDDDGTGTKGTPVDEQVYGDFHQFFSQLMLDGGLTANEIAENEYDGFQLNTALGNFINKLSQQLADNLNGGLRKKIANLGDWNMNSTGNISIALPSGVTLTKIRSVRVLILSDLSGGNYVGSDLLQAGYFVVDQLLNQLDFYRTGGGAFQSASYSTTGYNRGYVVIEYLP